MSMSGDELRVKLRVDTSALADDLAAVDRQIEKIQRLMQSAYNRAAGVRRGRAPRALNFADVMENREAWTPEVQRLERMLSGRFHQIERAAQAGETRPPPTARQAAQQAARDRLAQAARGTGRPVEITARQAFFDEMRKAFLKGLPSNAAMAAAGGRTGWASAAARGAMRGLEALGPEVAGPVGVAIAAGAAAVGGNAAAARFNRTQAALASSLVGGPGFGASRTLQGFALMHAALGEDVGARDMWPVAQQLAQAGMTPGAMIGNVSNVLGFAGAHGYNPSDITPLVSSLATQGGLNPQEINRVLQDLANGSKDATVSLDELVQGAKNLSRVSSSAAKDVSSLAAIQHIVGATSGINAGALLAPAMGVTGGGAFAAAGLLGMTPDQFLAAQTSRGGMARIWGGMSRFVKQLPPGAAGFESAVGMLGPGGANLLDMSGLNLQKQQAVYGALRAGQPAQAASLAAQYQAQTGKQAVSMGEDLRRNAAATDKNTGWLQRLSQIWETGTDAIKISIGELLMGGFAGGTSGSKPGGAPNSKVAGFLAAGGSVMTGRGKETALASAQVAQQAWEASGHDPVLFSAMMATMARESKFQAGAIQQGVPESQRGYGIAQFAATLGTAGLRKYLGPGDWHKAALTQGRAITGLAAYERDLIAQAHGDVQLAEGRYNAGPAGTASSTYAQQVYGATRALEQSLGVGQGGGTVNVAVDVTVHDERVSVKHTVNKSRVLGGSSHHGHAPPGHPLARR